MSAAHSFAGVRRVHIVGIGGAGMSAMAIALSGMGMSVSGSDLKESQAFSRLRAIGVEAYCGHRLEVVHGADLVTASSAVPAADPELAEARRLGIEVLPRKRVLAAIAATRRSVAVAGTHGKTTTTSMLALALVEAGFRPSFLIGGEVNEIGTNAVWDEGEWLVLEADESDGTFLELEPEVALVTNVEPDHLDHYGSFDALVDCFERYCRTARRVVLLGADDPVSAELARACGGLTVGQSSGAHYRMAGLSVGSDGSRFELWRERELLGELGIAVLGAHNARNAAMAAASALEIGASFTDVARALSRFAGVARRFEDRGIVRGARIVDDYAHLPSEVRAAVATAKAAGPRRVVAVFQPHRYSRTASLHESFADAFEGADVVVVTDVYGAGEAPVPGVTGQLVAEAVTRAHPEAAVSYVPGRAHLVEEVSRLLSPGDICLTLGAGDITSLADELAEADARSGGQGEEGDPR